ncbi:DNA polymerase III subunit gamma/tau [Ruminococcus sp. OA3]|uniref:DNA polymerase III subunit gamma/tau n=1 Tax=Ruminococcus sp. OA3 TaxID=2914164 RepID=UPI001F0550F7|nr:DNA polymerase III subunit gamma/tau [Ruminococcus sp. OA3]MCH1984413.1 DNA polymerase III subunit gamma/tau [Ruminococcus sp. OA3]
MSYTALYRKFRPDSFEDVKGQDHIVTTLKNQVRANRIGHAYLFCGTRGTGKTTVAKILAKTVNCEHPIDGSPCNECEMCKAIQAGTSMNVIEIDAASNNGVDNIREIREEVAYRPTQGIYKVYIIDEVHMLSTGAFNALLKTLEEPPSYVIFILATTEAHKIPITILSRCQRYDFRRITIDTIADRMTELMKQEGVEAEEKAVRYIAKAADGSLRDALSLLDQCIAFYLGQKLTYDNVLEVLGTVDTEIFSRMLRQIIDRNVTEVIHSLEELVLQGKEMGQFVSDFTWYLRNLMLVKSSSDSDEMLDISGENLQMLKEEGEMIETETLIRYIRILSELSSQIRYASQKRVLVEVALIKLCRPSMETNLDSVLDRIRVLEDRIEQGVVVKAPDVQEMSGGCNEEKKQSANLPKPEKAAPEDLQRVKNEWRTIVGQTEGMFRSFLQTAVPKYNGQTGEAKLYVEFSNSLAQNYVGNAEAAQRLADIIENQIGKSVELELILADREVSKGLAEISIDDILKDKIQMEVDIET